MSEAKKATPMSAAVTASCHCGAVSMVLASAPTEVVECNCSLCRRYGVLWTYYDVGDIQGLPAPEATDSYAWNGRHVDFYRCGTCGCITHWAPRASGRKNYGINARLLPVDVIAAARLRHKDGADTGNYLD